MNRNHNIISDLLPLYADGVCSAESAAAVESHLGECGECRAMLEEMNSNVFNQLPKTDGAAIIKKTERIITKEATFSVIGIAASLLFWIVYTLMKPYADVGDYRFFSYTTWEVLSLGFILVPVFNLVWIIVSICKAITKKEWKRRAVVTLLLAVLLMVQAGFWFVQSHSMSTSTVGWIEEVNDTSFVFNNGGGAITITCSYELIGLLKTDGTEYLVTYQTNTLFPNKTTLSIVQYAELASERRKEKAVLPPA